MRSIAKVVHQYAADREFLTPERCFITELLNEPSLSDLSIALARVAPGVTTQRHSLRETKEYYVIIAGTGRVEIGNAEPQIVERFDVVTIAPDALQQITNIGDTDLLFLCVCVPRFEPVVYIDQETK